VRRSRLFFKSTPAPNPRLTASVVAAGGGARGRARDFAHGRASHAVANRIAPRITPLSHEIIRGQALA
jgi:hypothetical protein